YMVDTYLGGGRILNLGTDGNRRAWDSRGTDVAVDGQGVVYVADADSDLITKLSPEASLLAVWGTSSRAPGQLQHPIAVAVDAAGNIYVAEAGNDRVQTLS